jgi:hypothetical protein
LAAFAAFSCCLPLLADLAAHRIGDIRVAGGCHDHRADDFGQLAAALGQRAPALGEQLAASPEPWLAGQLGVLAPHASPLLRHDYARRAAVAAAYREAAGITDPHQAIAPGPHRGNPDLDHLRQAAIRALEIRDETETIRRMTHGQLDARILDGTAPWPAPRPTPPANCDALQARADEAAHRIAAGNAARQARAQYTARLERQAHAQAEPAAQRQGEASAGIEIER